ncbi:MAG: hypothetical protein OEY49_20140 [Candidatus Heimdallarchaeota archaeon]|nr:hypothetical protein [Candidatus Heimdallarchaeota archaeon]
MNSQNLEEINTDKISHVYVVHKTGLPLLDREYNSTCMKNDPRLIGGFLGAVVLFSKNSYSTSLNECPRKSHLLTKVETSCSTWVISNIEDYFIATQIPKRSTLNYIPDLINQINSNILSTFTTFRAFCDDSRVESFLEYQQEFKEAVDIIVAESLSEMQRPYKKHNDTKLTIDQKQKISYF